MNEEKTFSKGDNTMAQKNSNTNLTGLLLECMVQPDPMLSMLEWLCKDKGTISVKT